MEQFITEVGLTSVSEPKEAMRVLSDSILEGLNDTLQILDQDDDESYWIFFGVGGPA